MLFLQRLHEENEKLFDRLTEKASLGGSPQVVVFDQIMMLFIFRSLHFNVGKTAVGIKTCCHMCLWLPVLYSLTHCIIVSYTLGNMLYPLHCIRIALFKWLKMLSFLSQNRNVEIAYAMTFQRIRVWVVTKVLCWLSTYLM